MKYARKLNIDFQWKHLHKDRFVVGMHGVHENYKGVYGVIRRHISQRELDSFKALLPESVGYSAATACFSEIQLLPPHVHYEEGCVINFYKETGGELTTFWEGEMEHDPSGMLDNGNRYYNVNVAKISPVESFVAKPGDVWLLDSRQAHSVSKHAEDALHGMKFYEEGFPPRFIVQVYMNLPFTEVARAFD